MLKFVNNMFYSSGSDVRRVYDYSFQWTKDHQTAEQLNGLRFSCDKVADDALKRLEEISEQQTANSADIAGSIPRPDLISILQENSKNDMILEKLWTEVCTVPDWVDWDQIGRGQDVLYRYALPLLTGFFFHAFFGINVSIW